MARNPHLDEAIAIYKELGWLDAPHEAALTLPLGTAAQRDAALAGLVSGDWDEWKDGRHVSHIDVDAVKLWLFSVRVGVDAQRAAATMTWQVPDDLAFAVVAERGPAFARTFVERIRTFGRGALEHHAALGSGVRVRLVAHHRLPVPQNREYLKDWAAHAAATLTGDTAHGARLDEAVIREQFAEHVRAGTAVGLVGAGPFGRVVPAGVARGWLDRDAAVGLVLTSLDAATRPGDRKVWLRTWLDDLHVTNAEIVDRAEALVPLLASGEALVVERLAPVLVAGVGDDQLADVATAALTAPTKKALRVVLRALAARPRPSQAPRETLGPQVTALSVDPDPALARVAQKVVDSWELTAAAPAGQVTVEGMWRPTPPVWTAPRFDHGDQTPEALTQAAAALSGRRDSEVVDVTVEKFLVLANAVARRDPELARTALRGVRRTFTAGLWHVESWVAGRPCVTTRDDPLAARERAVFEQLGQVPCLLSEPSTVDLRVHPADLLARLQAYHEVGASASEADLFLALTRLDVSLADAGLGRLAVPVLVSPGVLMRAMDYQTGRSTVLTAGEIASRYLADPAVEPVRTLADSPQLPRPWRAQWSGPASLSDFRRRLSGESSNANRRARNSAVFPTWGDAVDFPPADRYTGLRLRQLARRSAPLTPGAAVNVLVALRNVHAAAAPDVALALTEAWERGLLRPGVADVRYLDWVETPQALAATAQALGEAAHLGLLSVVWPVLDDLLVAATDAPRLLAGAAEVAQTVGALLPEVLHAVSTGLAGPDALALPGTRALAARKGSSQAVRAARAVIAHLPESGR
ncbi:MAG: hypothetical protein FWH11_12055 [Micrococcales bacterium]|nr:hypothetical protein [Micrococcales bacterium]